MKPAMPKRDNLAATTRRDSELAARPKQDNKPRTGRINRAAISPAIVEFSRGRQRAAVLRSTQPNPLPEVPAAEDGETADEGDARRGVQWRRGLTTMGTLGAVGILAAPFPATAAPTQCGQAERYSAQSGSQILRINALGMGTPAAAPDDAIAHIGDARSALVANPLLTSAADAALNSAAVARMIDTKDDATPADLTAAVQQQAPPTNKKQTVRSTPGAEVGPVSLGAGKLTAHAQWQAAMACAATVGEVTRATAQLSDAGILSEGDEPLVRVPKVTSESTTELERRGQATASVASAGLTGGGVDLFNGAVQVKILKPPSLRASMSTKDGGEVRYIPAVVEVSGKGVETSRLDAAGDRVDFVIAAEMDKSDGPASRTAANGSGNDGSATDSSPGDGSPTDDSAANGSAAGDSAAGGPKAGGPKAGGSTAGALGEIPRADDLQDAGDDGSLPEIPDVPEVKDPTTESAPVTDSGTTVTISLGDVQQAARDHAIAARAAALSVTIAQAPSGTRSDPGYTESREINFDMGMMEVAAISPEPAGQASTAEAAGATPDKGGTGGGLPITGPSVNRMILGGLAFLAAGTAALIFALRTRPRP
ncbi:hypothetical protein [Winogradskya humida]|uniref:Gram-positive cocci surface proteins LPxTG domain-containing protein n=1 Tax=Winogradskya humida TaxID=113566 RepID=A0ABQ3ZM55_9ACTN|nr:hypothetical protein [Actinoplanes humidus]GIE19674.1 hypothetical protein Ahu01nite_027760 [Actinoplanes humidus]